MRFPFCEQVLRRHRSRQCGNLVLRRPPVPGMSLSVSRRACGAMYFERICKQSGM